MTWLDMLLRLGMAAGCGVVIGFEREHRHQSAGIKTHTLVCMGAALVSMIQLLMVQEAVKQVQADPLLANVLKSDYGRLGAQVISGIGFLGAGTILHNKASVRGLTTAATLWLVACTGLAVGMGYYIIAAMTVALAEISINTIRLVQNAWQKKHGSKCVEIVLTNKRKAMNAVNDYCAVHGVFVVSMEYVDSSDVGNGGDPATDTYRYTLRLPRALRLETVLAQLQMEDSIRSATVASPLEYVEYENAKNAG